MADGSRHFAELPDIHMAAFRKHLQKLAEVQFDEETTDGITEWWLDFTYKGQEFTAHETWGCLRVFSNDAKCPPDILTELMGHFWLLQKY